MNEKECVLCGSTEIKIIFSSPLNNTKKIEQFGFSPTVSDFGVFYKLAQCQECGVVFSLLDNQDLTLSYSASNDDLYLNQALERTVTYKRILRDIKKFVSDNACFLDVGCSYGLLLKLAKEVGSKVYGVELSENACRYAREKLGLNVVCADVAEIKFSNNYFDVITAIEIIEHLSNPKNFILHMYKILKPGGYYI